MTTTGLVTVIVTAVSVTTAMGVDRTLSGGAGPAQAGAPAV